MPIADTDDWEKSIFAATAAAAGQWGGGGFIPIPHQHGKVEAVFRRLVGLYDPDHISAVACEDLTWMRLFELDVHLPGGRKMTADEFEAHPGRIAGHMEIDEGDGMARDLLAALCNPFRFADEGGFLAQQEIRTPVPLPAPWSQIKADGPLVCGTVARSALSGQTTMAANENFVYASDWMRSGGLWHSAYLVRVMKGISRPKRWLVVGTGLRDYALAYTLSRIGEEVTWFDLPPNGTWREDPSAVTKTVLGVANRRSSAAAEVLVTSLTEDPEAVAADLIQMVQRVLPSSMTPKGLRALTATNLMEVDLAAGYLAMEDDFDRDVLLPSKTSVEGVQIDVRLPAIAPRTPSVQPQSRPHWLIDVELGGSSTPTGRPVSAQGLQDAQGGWPERVRPSRFGTVVEAGSFGFVPSGASFRSSVARPRLRFPSGSSWLRARATECQVELKVSDAGYRQVRAAALFASTNAMSEMIRRHYALFRTFQSEGTTDSAFGLHEGVILHGKVAVLSFKGIERELQESADAARGIADDLLQQGVLRRGLVLRCSYCAHLGWYPLVDIAQRIICSRCATGFELRQQTWKRPLEEPIWFYDLHPALRDLLSDNGEIPLLAALSIIGEKSIRNAEILPELEIRVGGNSSPSEIDLVLTSPGFVAVGEAKARSRMNPKEVQRKLASIRAAVELTWADEVVLASRDDSEWDRALVDKLSRALADSPRPDGVVPKFRLITGLGGATVHHVIACA